MAEKVVYTGAIDAYFDYKLGALEYRSVRFETELLDRPNFQGNAAVNYTDAETPWTRIIEHKWFEFGKDAEGNDLPKTVISREYSSEWKPGDEPYYPVNDEKNGALYEKYKDKNFVIIGFPANNFMGQEPGSNEEIAKFCSLNYDVTFPMMSKISVKGKDMAPLYQWLTEKKLNGKEDAPVQWNFQKFMIDENGNWIGFVAPKESPFSEKILTWI